MDTSTLDALERSIEQWELIDSRFRQLVEGLGIEQDRNNCRCPNPEHKDSHASAQINEVWANVYCYTCQKGWKAPDLIEMVVGVSDKREKLKIGLNLVGAVVPEWLDGAAIQTAIAPRKKAEEIEEPETIIPNIQSLDSRDRDYQVIRSKYELLPDHRKNLKKRGLTDEEIEWGGYVSIDYESPLPGFAEKSPAGGFTCPIRQYGKVAGLQIRTAFVGAKYVWVSINRSCHIKVTDKGRTESPLSFLIGSDTDRPMLSEGFLKTDIIYLKTGKTCIGAAGGNWSAGQAQLLDYIQKFNPKGFDIFADSDTIGNTSVAKRTWRQILEFQKLGLEVRVADYGQLFDKSLPSPDDWLVAGGDIDQIHWLSAKEFRLKCMSVGIETEIPTAAISVSPTGEITKEKWEKKHSEIRKKWEAVESENAAIVEAEAERDFKEWILNKALAVFHKPTIKNNHRQFIRPSNSVDLYFPEGGRLAAIETAIALGKKLIADFSPTGTGKSKEMDAMNQLGPQHFGVSRLLFVTEDPRNITVTGLENVTRIDSRHRGITINENGERRIAKKGEKLVSPATCLAPEIFAALRSAGIENADSSAIGCVGCPHFNQCKSPASKYDFDKPNYIYQRKVGLGQKAMIVHPQSLPHPKSLSLDSQKFPYSKSQKTKDLGALLYWEEFGKNPISTKIVVSEKDIKETFFQISANPVDFFKSDVDSIAFFTPILHKLQRIIETDNSRFGISHQEVVKEFDIELIKSAFSSDELKEIYAAIAPNLNFLKDSFRHDIEYSIKEAEKIAKQWLHHFFGVLIGERLGHFHIAHGQLIIDIFNSRIPQIVEEAEINIFSDATLTRDRLAAMLRVSPDDIFVICQETDLPKNLTIKQIPIRSYLHRGADQSRRIEAAKAEIISRHPNEAIAVIGSKKAGDSRYWFNHNRGSNFAYKEMIKHLILDGTPVQNIASLEAEYHLLYGAIANPEQLQKFTLEKIYIEFIQALGRPRANLRQDKITVWAITDIDLSPLGYPVEKVDLGSLSLSCLGMVDRLKRKIGDAIKSGAESCQAIAEKIGCSQGRISQIAKEYGGFRRLRQILISLLDNLNKEINIPAFDGQEDPEALTSLALEFLGIVTSADSFLGGLANAAKVYGESGLKRAIAALKNLDIDYFEATLEYTWQELILSLDNFSICENL